MEQNGRMTPLWIYILAGIGVLGSLYAVFAL